MKKLIIPVLALLFAMGASAQSASFGIKGGITGSKINGDANESLKQLIDFTGGIMNTENLLGWHAGGFVNIPLGAGLSIEPNLEYNQRGYQVKGKLQVKGAEVLSGNVTARLKQHYIDLPVLLKYNYNGLNLFAGPRVSLLADSKLRVSAGTLGFNFFQKDYDMNNQFNDIDAGIRAGLGYEFPNGLGIQVAYDHGLTKIDSDRRLDAFNRSVQGGLTFKF